MAAIETPPPRRDLWSEVNALEISLARAVASIICKDDALRLADKRLEELGDIAGQHPVRKAIAKSLSE